MEKLEKRMADADLHNENKRREEATLLADIRKAAATLGVWAAASLAQERTTLPVGSPHPGPIPPKKRRREADPSDDDSQAPDTPPDPVQITDADVSPKVLTLLRLLEEHESDEMIQSCARDFRALIHVEHRNTAKVLSEIIALIAPSRFPSITATFLPAYGPRADGGSRSKSGMVRDKLAMEMFRRGEKNLVVLGLAGEERPDIPTCSLVIFFDPPGTQQSFFRARDRVRDSSDSQFIVMVPRGDSTVLRKFAESRTAHTAVRAAAAAAAARRGARPIAAPIDRVLRSDTDEDVIVALLGSHESALITDAGKSITATAARD
ncbi:hypothetical protein BDK51DRAFT_25594, partial [Blyttiomyces helicus]